MVNEFSGVANKVPVERKHTQTSHTDDEELQMLSRTVDLSAVWAHSNKNLFLTTKSNSHIRAQLLHMPSDEVKENKQVRWKRSRKRPPVTRYLTSHSFFRNSRRNTSWTGRPPHSRTAVDILPSLRVQLFLEFRQPIPIYHFSKLVFYARIKMFELGVKNAGRNLGHGYKLALISD